MGAMANSKFEIRNPKFLIGGWLILWRSSVAFVGKVVFSVARQTVRGVLRIVVPGLLLLAVVLGAAALVQRSKPELSPWHKFALKTEFDAKDARDDFGWADYLALEDTVFRELEEKIVRHSRPHANEAWSRYADGGVNNPANFPHNWNRSYEMKASPPLGGALLIHGLTDSPYSLRRTAEILNARGLYVVGLRLPGHGTVPAALNRVEVEDWRAAVRIACEHLQKVIGTSGKLILVGYSNGGALAIDYTLDSLSEESLRIPDRVILYSPAIGITRAAAFARAHHVLSFMPWFNRLGWQSIEPELDPFKYNSFPNDAGYETHVLTRSVRRRVEQLDQQGAVDGFPPVLAFMSLADSTVLVEAVVEGLFDRLDNPENELVIFDINRRARMHDLFRSDPASRLRSLTERSTTQYRLTVISNINENSDTLGEWSRPAGKTEAVETDLDLEWPRGFYSLSHVALPFPANDVIYGTHPDPENLFGIQLGSLEVRGEKGLLALPAEQLIRLRSNPFFSYIERRVIETAG